MLVPGVCSRLVGLIEQTVEPLLPVGQVARLTSLQVFEMLDDLQNLFGLDLTVLESLEKIAQQRGILRAQGLLSLGDRPMHLPDANRRVMIAESLLHLDGIRSVLLRGSGHGHPAMQNSRDGIHDPGMCHARLHRVHVLPGQAHGQVQPFRDALLALAELEEDLHGVLQILLRGRQRSSDVCLVGLRDHVGLAVDVYDRGIDLADTIELMRLNPVTAVDDLVLLGDHDRREFHPRFDQLTQAECVILIEHLSYEQVHLQVLQCDSDRLHAFLLLAVCYLPNFRLGTSSGVTKRAWLARHPARFL